MVGSIFYHENLPRCFAVFHVEEKMGGKVIDHKKLETIKQVHSNASFDPRHSHSGIKDRIRKRKAHSERKDARWYALDLKNRSWIAI